MYGHTNKWNLDMSLFLVMELNSKGNKDLDSRPEALKKLVATGGVGQFEIPIQDIQSYK